MFTPEFAINTIQSGKKTFVNSFVTDETMKSTMLKFIDAQTEYTNQFVKTTTELGTTLATHATKTLTDVSKMDVTKVFENINKAFKVK